MYGVNDCGAYRPYRCALKNGSKPACKLEKFLICYGSRFRPSAERRRRLSFGLFISANAKLQIMCIQPRNQIFFVQFCPKLYLRYLLACFQFHIDTLLYRFQFLVTAVLEKLPKCAPAARNCGPVQHESEISDLGFRVPNPLSVFSRSHNWYQFPHGLHF